MNDIPELSVIIPTLNEEANVRRLISALQTLQPIPQVVISDGGSDDQTVALARELGAEVVTGARGRGPQLNCGAGKGRGDTLLFLHADSTLPEKTYRALIRTLREHPELDGGALRFSLADTPGIWPRIYETGVHWRNTLFNLPYGDQGFFLRRSCWNEQTCFAEWPLMEDVEWWDRLRRSHNMRILPWPLVTSARRFRQRGYLQSALRNLTTITRYKLGASPVQLAKEYHR